MLPDRPRDAEGLVRHPSSAIRPRPSVHSTFLFDDPKIEGMTLIDAVARFLEVSKP